MAAMGYELRERLFRLKSIGADFLDTQLKRCLSTFDITLLGIGHMIGAGIYVLTGSVVRNMAGPGIVLSFIFAGIASLLSALCYAEFGARVPKAGSAYTYTYITVGEFWAFIIGWNIILEHMLGAAAVARSWSGYLDSLLGHVIKNATIANVGSMEESSLFGDYPDIVAFVVVIAVAAFMGYGAKASTNFNTIFTFVNMAVILFVVVFGFSFADFSLWSGTDPITGYSRFMPMGFNGVLAGAASCFFAYIGFDGLATAGEEASDPGRSIPIATFVSMSIVTGSYVLMAASLTLMVPYWKVHPTAAFSDAFETRGALWAKYIVAIGALSGMTTSLVGSMFALPRCVYAMAHDGLIFKSLAQIHPKTQVPTYAVLVFGAATAMIALMFDIETLVEFLSIGTLMAYTIVSGSVIILRYQPSQDRDKDHSGIQATHEEDTAMLVGDSLAGKPRPFVPAPLRPLMERFMPGSLVTWSVLGMVCSNLMLSFSLSYGSMHSAGHIFLCILFASISFFWFAVIYSHHQNEAPLNFKVPLVPLIPALSVLVNILLMSHLAAVTWIRLVIWLSIGFCIYFFYGMKHSVENSAAQLPKSTTYDTMVVTPATTPGGGDPPKLDLTFEQPQPVDKKH